LEENFWFERKFLVSKENLAALNEILAARNEFWRLEMDFCGLKVNLSV